MADDNGNGIAVTALFVESVVVGCGATGVASLVLAALVGWGWLKPLAAAGPLSIGLIALVYVLGVVVDRVGDSLGEPLAGRWRRESYPGGGSRDYDADLLAVIQVSPLSSRLAYGRSRLRVCRGWALNTAVGTLALAAYVFSTAPGAARLKPLVAGEIGLFVLGGGCIYAWRSLARTQYRQVAAEAELLQSRTEPAAPI